MSIRVRVYEILCIMNRYSLYFKLPLDQDVYLDKKT